MQVPLAQGPLTTASTRRALLVAVQLALERLEELPSTTQPSWALVLVLVPVQELVLPVALTSSSLPRLQLDCLASSSRCLLLLPDQGLVRPLFSQATLLLVQQQHLRQEWRHSLRRLLSSADFPLLDVDEDDVEGRLDNNLGKIKL